MGLILLLGTVGLTVFAVIRILEVPLRVPQSPRGRGRAKRRRSAFSIARLWKAVTRRPVAAQDAAPANLRTASSRLVLALVLLAAAGALLIVLIIRWVGAIFEGITS